MSINPQFMPETKPLEAWRQALMDAANLIRRRGLAYGVFEGPDGEVCTLGAIAIVTTGCWKNYEAPEVCDAENRLRKHLGNWDSIPTWNDARSKDEVIAALEAAALS